MKSAPFPTEHGPWRWDGENMVREIAAPSEPGEDSHVTLFRGKRKPASTPEPEPTTED